MSTQPAQNRVHGITSLDELAQYVDYSFIDRLTPDPEAKESGNDFMPRQVFSGHYVPVAPTPLPNPKYIAHSNTLFDELGLDEKLAHTEKFMRLFSGDLSVAPEPMRKLGWATGYALSIYGTEYIQQCPFQTGNGYGDGRAISILEVVLNAKRWEMQLKGSGRTPYCRGADGRAVLRSSVREFLVQEHMHALGVPTSRSLSLFVSDTEKVERPWYLEGSNSTDPEIMVANPIAISTRVASSFLRVGQLELFARRARTEEHADAVSELSAIVNHLINREYQNAIDTSWPMKEQLVTLAKEYRNRLIQLVVNWLRVGYCQGNFNSDNCAVGGFTLDYGPFGFCELFDPMFQPWTGGGRHFSFFNQPVAAQKNYEMFCRSLEPLLADNPEALDQLQVLRDEFIPCMEQHMKTMWASKLGIPTYDSDLFVELMQLMIDTAVDYTVFFRELCNIPSNVSQIESSFYRPATKDIANRWNQWLSKWRGMIKDGNTERLSELMKTINPKYTWREWLVVPAYKAAEKGDYSLIEELQAVLAKPYEEQSPDIENKFYQLRPLQFFETGGISHYSCSS